MAVSVSPRPSDPTGQHDALEQALARPIVVRWQTVVYALIFIAAVFTRFWALGDRAMSHDESLHVYYSYNLYMRGDFDHTPLMHGPILFHANALMYALFGDNDFSGRIYTALLGVAMVFSPLLFRRWLGNWGALLACVMILASPLLMYYNRYIREDTPAIMASILMAWAIMMYLNGPADQRRKPRWLYVLSAAMLWNLGTKETAFMYVASFGLFFTIYWVVRMLQVRFAMQGRTVFNTLMMSILIGAVMAVPMYIILAITPLSALTTASQFEGIFNNLESRSLIIWTVLALLSVVAVVVGTAMWAFRGRSVPWREVAIIIVTALLVLVALVVIEELSHVGPAVTVETAVPIDPTAGGEAVAAEGGISWRIVAIPWLVTLFLLPLLYRSRQKGWWDWLNQFPELDVLIVMGALILPWLTAIFIVGAGGSVADLTALGTNFSGLAGILPVTGPLEIGRFIVGLLCFLPMFVLAIVGGLTWNWRRFVVCWLIFHALFAFFFTTVFTNIYGLHSGMIYSLQYWMEQQGERRGSQPQYYYFLIVLPMYEFLPIIGSIAATFAGSFIFWKRRRATLELEAQADELDKQKADHVRVEGDSVVIDHDAGALLRYQTDEVREQLRVHQFTNQAPMLMFIGWWALTIMIALTLAGEKMPWLGTHMTTPMILLTGWYFGRVVQRIEWASFKKLGWVFLILFPLALAAAFRVLAGYVTEEQPFRGVEQYQLVYTYNFIGALVVLVATVWALDWVRRRTSARHLRQMFAASVLMVLSLITFRSAWQASFINYDYANEFLVYAHATPNTKTVIDMMEDFSQRTTDGMGLTFAYDNKLSWPGVWYFRNFDNAIYMGENPTLQQMEQANVVLVGDANRNVVEPLLEDRYQRFDHKRMWWPMQDYFDLNAMRMNDVFALSEDPLMPTVDSGRLRRALFDIWWNKDYTLYGEVTNKTFSFDRWPVSENFYVYVRRDYAAQVWVLT
ncbi:MAG: glycosyltransferase family 39 protein [Anaerolineae bacterium]|nr:glycosyltransferase family 39 protein [Anaerolineae bacterium]